MRKRSTNARTERAGLIAVEKACNELNLIWRDLFQEDVGVDGTIEIVVGDFPSGKLVGAQVKSGRSYIRSETEDSFRFYPRDGDLDYWGQLSIPLFLFVHDPETDITYWLDVSRHIQARGDDPLGTAYLLVPKENRLGERFADYLRGLFDLSVYDDAQFAALRAELEAITHTGGVGAGEVTVTALDLFVGGLWGLCSKLQFHSSLLADVFRKAVYERRADIVVRYSFSRADLYPFFIAYIAAVTTHHLATIDAGDINESLYRKLEFPTFIAPLTTNGRRFVDYLRAHGRSDAHDNRYFTLAVIPHAQIEVYSRFDGERDGRPVFGPYTDVLGISFNPHLDYYYVEHWRRTEPEGPASQVMAQNAFYFELTDYIERTFHGVDKDTILLRHLDIPLTPLSCWLERWYESEQPMAGSAFGGKSNVENYGLHDELLSIFGAAGAVDLSEPIVPRLPLSRLGSGELLRRETG
ncbi:DUF4365 domain-containing protein [Sphingomonas sp.]|uniref:DUF4365 domain-containing protein n=1 Tax=Sphingomonas sp. TaxID=28214 RepID=UPI0025F19738|nr:DUF4365 domain-containing protein [Sphingomonas sp.]